jgi:hypothetical protein
MDGAENDIKSRERRIAENESNRQIEGDVRVSTWAIGVAGILVLIGFAIGWLLLRR